MLQSALGPEIDAFIFICLSEQYMIFDIHLRASCIMIHVLQNAFEALLENCFDLDS